MHVKNSPMRLYGKQDTDVLKKGGLKVQGLNFKETKSLYSDCYEILKLKVIYQPECGCHSKQVCLVE